jgi:hypothetical protein
MGMADDYYSQAKVCEHEFIIGATAVINNRFERALKIPKC